MRRLLALGAAALTLAVSAVVLSATSALADPSANDWASLRQCESGGRYNINTGNGYYGAYQFDLSTWRSVGGSGLPSDAAPAEQDYRALYLYRMRGWSPWTCASLAGLHEDSSAKSKVVPSTADSAYMSGGSGNFALPATSTCNIGGSTAPQWGGEVMVEGKTYTAMICFQKQLGHLGYGLTGSGYFGVNTQSALHKFESDHGLPQTAAVDRATWVAAWGKDGGDKPGVAPAAPSPSAADPALYPGNTAQSCQVGAATAPAWPGRSWTLGAYDRALGCWQMQMATRGYSQLHGNGYYAANTLAAAKDIQNKYHLGGSGLIGPQTWKAAWEGK